MARAPLSRLYTGKPGRPKAVRALARSIIAAVLEADLVDAGMIGLAMPKPVLAKYAKEIASDLTDRLAEADLHIIPGPLAREFALLAGEPAEAAKALAPTVGADQPTERES